MFKKASILLIAIGLLGFSRIVMAIGSDTAPMYTTCIDNENNKLSNTCFDAYTSQGVTNLDDYHSCYVQLTAASESKIETKCRQQAGLDNQPNQFHSNKTSGAPMVPGGTSSSSQPTKPAQTQGGVTKVAKSQARVPSAASAQAEADGDVASCDALKGTASVCCGNPMSCSNQLSAQDQRSLAQLEASMNSGGGASGLSGDCSQMQQLGNSSGQVNSALAGICASDQSSCANTCGSLVQKYQARLANCNGCQAEAIYQYALSALSSAQGSCQALQARASQLTAQGLSSASSTGVGEACNQLASASPSSLNPGPTPVQAVNTNDPYGCQANPNSPACLSCAQNPSLPGCQPSSAVTGQAQFTQTPSQVNASDFNVGDPSAGVQAQMAIPVTPVQGMKVPKVANNSGGGVPGTDTGGFGGRRNSAAASPKAISMGSGFSTDIMQGFRSGGYSEPVGEAGYSSGLNPSFQLWRGTASNSNFHAIDLRRFLPGARSAQLQNITQQINGMSVDIWSKISSMYIEKCRLGLLFECR